MNRRGLFGLLSVGLTVAVAYGGWWWLTRPDSPSARIVIQGSSSNSESLGVSGGHLVVIAPRPGVFFGTVRKPQSEEQLTYVILFRYGRPTANGTGQGLHYNCTSDANEAVASNAIELDGKQIKAVYRIQLNETRTAVESESLEVGGERVDPDAGRVFLVNLTDVPPAYHQKKLELPAVTEKLESLQAIERAANSIRQRLSDQDPEVRAFLQ